MHAPSGNSRWSGKGRSGRAEANLGPRRPPRPLPFPRAEGRAAAQTEASRPGYAPATKTERFAPVTLNVGPEAFTLFSAAFVHAIFLH